MKGFRSLLVVLFILLIYQFSAQAGLSVDPVVSEVIALPGKETIQNFKLKNTGENTILVRIEAEPIEKGDDVSKWIIIKQKEFKLEPDAEYDFLCIINPSEDVQTGELRGRLFFVADEIDEKGNLKSMVGIRFGIPIYAVIQGRTILDAEIKSGEFKYNKEKHLFSGKIEVNNKSNVHIRPLIDIIIFDNANKEIFKFRVPYGQVVQKEQVRYLVMQNNMEIADGIYKALVNLDYGALYGIKDRIASKEFEFAAGNPVEDKTILEDKKDEKAGK